VVFENASYTGLTALTRSVFSAAFGSPADPDPAAPASPPAPPGEPWPETVAAAARPRAALAAGAPPDAQLPHPARAPDAPPRPPGARGRDRGCAGGGGARLRVARARELASARPARLPALRHPHDADPASAGAAPRGRSRGGRPRLGSGHGSRTADDPRRRRRV